MSKFNDDIALSFRHYGLGDFVPNARDAGWDYCSQPLLLSPIELKTLVKETRNPDYIKVKLEVIHGRELTVEDLNESHDQLDDRVSTTLRSLQQILQRRNEHIVAIAHESTIEVFARVYGVSCVLYF
jgi:hypothetical protein